MQRYTGASFPNVGAVVDGIYDRCDFRGADLQARELRGSFFHCDFTGARFDKCVVTTSTLFYCCEGLPGWMSRPMVGAKRGDLWGEHGKVKW